MTNILSDIFFNSQFRQKTYSQGGHSIGALFPRPLFNRNVSVASFLSTKGLMDHCVAIRKNSWRRIIDKSAMRPLFCFDGESLGD